MSDALNPNIQERDNIFIQKQKDILKYFNNNGFKECQILNLNENNLSNKFFSIKAMEQELNKYVVIKIIFGESLNETEKQVSKIQEIKCQFLQKYHRIQQNLNPNFLYYYSDYHDKSNLQEFSRISNLNIDIVERIVCKILIAINQLHENNLFHGRIKLENILIDQNESVKISDYGITEDDNYLLEDIGKNRITLVDQQKQDNYRIGIIIIFLCDILREKEKDLPSIMKYNTNRCHKLNAIANQMMLNVTQAINIKEILQNLDYFEGTYQNLLKGMLGMYEGEIHNSKKHGRGIVKYYNGSIQISTWKDDKRLKNGIIYYKNGNICEKDFSEESNKGRVYWFKQQAMYEGELQGYQLTGYGVYLINGDYQIGQFTKGQINGQGEIYYKNGDIYKGNFKNHKKQGIGKLIWSTGQTYIGNWEDNQLSGIGILKNTNGSEQTGEYKNGCLDGHAVVYWQDGSYYEGYYKNNLKEGKGKLYTSYNQSIYEGEFKKDLMHGYGKLTSPQQGVKQGYWKDNIFQPDQKNPEKQENTCYLF